MKKLSLLLFICIFYTKMNAQKSNTMESFAITNVRVFDGNKLSPLKTIVIKNGLISNDKTAKITIDGKGGTILPGLIDTHVHILNGNELKEAAKWGVTTVLDMASNPGSLDSLRNILGSPYILSSGTPASAPGGVQTTRMGFGINSAVKGPEDAERFIKEHVKEGSDYIKIVVEDPAVMGKSALSLETVKELVKYAHKYNLKTYGHLTSLPGLQIAIDAKIDVLEHAPVDGVITDKQIEQIKANKTIITPTLIMMKGAAEFTSKMPTHNGKIVSYDNAKNTVTKMHKAGIPILMGTDAYGGPNSPYAVVKHGESAHTELTLLVEAGLTPTEALRSATILPAQLLNLKDRGAIEPGKKADFLLIDGDPTKDINTTKNIKGLWISGIKIL